MPIVTTNCSCCSRDLVFPEEAALWSCPACGTMNARPQAEGTALDALRRAIAQRLKCDFERAENSYQHVLLDSPEEHEALWGLALCRYGVEYVDDPRTGKRMPVVHCIRNKPMQLDSDFQQACDFAPEEVRAQYERDAAYIDDAMARVRELAQSCPPYDVFICHKTTRPGSSEYSEDYTRAFKLYHMLDKAGYRSFFAPMEMEGVAAGADYEAAIYHALDTAKVMLVVCSDAENLSSPWVRSEWQRFLEMTDENAQKGLVPLMYGGMPVTRLPRDFRVRRLQAVQMGELESAMMMMNAVKRYAGVPQSAVAVPVTPQPVAPVVQPAVVQPVAPQPVVPQPVAPVVQPVVPKPVAPQPASPVARPAVSSPEVKQPPKPAAPAAKPDVKPAAKTPVLPASTCTKCGHKLVFLPGEKAVTCPACRTKNHRPAPPAAQKLATDVRQSLSVPCLSCGHKLVFLRGERGINCPRCRAYNVRVDEPVQEKAAQILREQKQQTGQPSAALTAQRAALTRTLRAVLTMKQQSSGPRRFREGDFETEMMNRGCEIVKYHGQGGAVSVPAFVSGQRVTQIGRRAFAGCAGLTSVRMPDSVTHIGIGAFRDCRALAQVMLPEKLVLIGEAAFAGCPGLKTVTVPRSASVIGTNAFGGVYGATLMVYHGSPAHQYAQAGGLRFVVIDQPAQQKAAPSPAPVRTPPPAPQPAPAPRPDPSAALRRTHALLTIKRTYKYFSSARKIAVRIDEDAVHELGTGESTALWVAPGKHRVDIKLVPLLGGDVKWDSRWTLKDVFPQELKAGQSYEIDLADWVNKLIF